MTHILSPSFFLEPSIGTVPVSHWAATTGNQLETLKEKCTFLQTFSLNLFSGHVGAEGLHTDVKSCNTFHQWCFRDSRAGCWDQTTKPVFRNIHGHIRCIRCVISSTSGSFPAVFPQRTQFYSHADTNVPCWRALGLFCIKMQQIAAFFAKFKFTSTNASDNTRKPVSTSETQFLTHLNPLKLHESTQESCSGRCLLIKT